MEVRSVSVGVVLVIAIIGVSFASIFIRLAAAPPLATATYRMGFTVLLLAPLGWYTARHEFEQLSLQNLAASMGAGLALALHFWTWIASLELTTVASSVVLYTSHVLLVALADRLLYDETLPLAGWLTAMVAAAGSATIGYGDLRFSGEAFWGDLLALAGALFMAVYLLVGRRVRRELSVLPYTVLVYGAATVILVILSVGTGTPLYPYTPTQYLLFAALAVVPTVFGHTLFNWALKYIPTTGVSISALGESVGAALLAWLILNEVPTPQQVIGGVLILAGIVAFMRVTGAHRQSSEER